MQANFLAVAAQEVALPLSAVEKVVPEDHLAAMSASFDHEVYVVVAVVAESPICLNSMKINYILTFLYGF